MIDAINIQSEHLMSSRHMRVTLQEVGVFAALVAFAEVLRPSSRFVYTEIHNASKEQQENLAQLRNMDLDMTVEDMDADSWYG